MNSKEVVEKMLEQIEGINWDKREGLKDTPARVAKSWTELFAGYRMDARDVLGTTFEAKGYDQMIVVKDIEFFSFCEHHILPFFGHVHIAYVPQGSVVGLSKLARLVECFARRLQIQEMLTKEIADAIWRVLEPKGCAVIVEAKHSCMLARGVQKKDSTMVTSALHGVLKENAEARAEFLSLVREK